MSWESILLGDFLTLKRGYDLPNKQRKDGTVPVVSSSGITGWHNISKVDGPGVVTGRYGTLGEVYFISDNFWPLNTALYVQDFKGNDRRFVAYFLKSILKGTTSNKAAVPGVNRNDLHRRKVVATTNIRLQKSIVSVLSTYDDLIVNNQRRIQLLEQAARLLYKEWFVHLRFPGHEHTKIKDGVPEGWERKKIGDFCIVGRGASPRPIKNFLEGDVPWFKIGDATASESPYIFQTAEKVTKDGALKSVWLQEGELILSNSATCGIPNFTGVSGCIHDGWLYFKNLHRLDKWFLYLYLCHQQRALLQGIGDGATQKNLNTSYVSHQKLIIPKSDNILMAFTELTEPLFEQIINVARQNNQLGQARDLLLPKLMNGELTV